MSIRDAFWTIVGDGRLIDAILEYNPSYPSDGSDLLPGILTGARWEFAHEWPDVGEAFASLLSDDSLDAPLRVEAHAGTSTDVAAAAAVFANADVALLSVCLRKDVRFFGRAFVHWDRTPGVVFRTGAILGRDRVYDSSCGFAVAQFALRTAANAIGQEPQRGRID